MPVYSRNRRGILVVEHLKSNPHECVDAARLSKAQQKEDVDVLIVTQNYALKTTVSELKYSGNKFGKKMYDDSELGSGYMIKIEDALNDLDLPKKEKKAIDKPKDSIKAIDLLKEEEIMTKDHKKIRLNRFDLFDDNDE